MIDTQALDERIKESGLSKTFIAGKLGISRYALYCKLDGKTVFTYPEAETLGDILGIKTYRERRQIFLPKGSEK